MVGMAEIKVAVSTISNGGEGAVLTALGLGSCVGICAYERYAGVAGLAHVVLPYSAHAGEEPPGKFADTAVPALLMEMQRHGAIASRICVAIAGGAQLFSFGGGAARLEIGARNAQSVIEALKLHRLHVVANDLGGTAGRTLQFFTADGRIRVKTIGRGIVDLVCLGDQNVTLLRAA